MTWEHAPYILPLIAAGMVAIVLAVFAWHRRPAPGSASAVALMCVLAVWSLAAAAENSFIELDAKLFWASIECIASTAVPAVWLAFILVYTGNRVRTHMWCSVCLVVEPLIISGLVVTNRWHGLIWPTATLVSHGQVVLLQLTHGWAFYVHVAFAYVLMVLGVILVTRALMKSPVFGRKQSVVIIAAAVAPWIANAAYILGAARWPPVDLTPFAFILTGGLAAIGLFRYRLLDLVPIGRDAAFDAMRDGVLVLDRGLAVVSANRAAGAMVGRSQRSMVGLHIDDIFGEWSDVFQGPDSRSVESVERSLVRNGQRLTLNVMVSSLPGDRREAAGWLLVIRDVIAQREAQRALAIGEAKYRAVVETARDVIVTEDMAGRITYVNPAGLRITGYSLDEVTGADIRTFVPPEFQSEMEARLSRRQSGDRDVFLYEAELLTKDRERVPIEVSSAPFADRDGSAGILIVARDIRERVEMRRTRWRRNRELMALNRVARAVSGILDLSALLTIVLNEVRELMDATATSIWLTDRATGDLVCRESAGPHSELVQGWRLRRGHGLAGWVAEHGERLVVDDVASDSRHVDTVSQQAGLSFRTVVSVPLRARTDVIGVLQVADERANRYETSDVILIESLGATAAIAIENARMFGDEEARVNALTQALEKQRELDRLKDDFIRNVSHELRTPLAIARGYAELLESGDLGELQPEHRDPIAVISRRMRSLSAMMDDIAAISDLDRDGLRMLPLDMGELLEDRLSAFESAVECAQLRLEREIEQPAPQLCADETYLSQMIDKLLSNAVKFTAAGGEIRVSLKRVGEEAVLTVADTGIGIPPDQMTRIFERFYQVDGSTTRRYGGAGLGLSVVREVAAAHGGAVDVVSEEGKGSTFTVRIPARGSALGVSETDFLRGLEADR